MIQALRAGCVWMAVVGFSGLVGSGSASGAFINLSDIPISGTSNVFNAGGNAQPSGTAAAGFSFGAGAGQYLQLTSVTGTVSGNGQVSNGPDGLIGVTAVVGDQGGISGISADNRTFFLAGVFLNDSIPVPPAPASLNFPNDQFTTLSPLLGQVFFIGDGRNSADNALQSFLAPADASRLFLGIVDGPNFYGDNSGSFNVSFAVVPEPSSVALLSIGLAGSFLAARFRRRASAV